MNQQNEYEAFEKIWLAPNTVNCPYGRGNGTFSICNLSVTNRKLASKECFKAGIEYERKNTEKLKKFIELVGEISKREKEEEPIFKCSYDQEVGYTCDYCQF